MKRLLKHYVTDFSMSGTWFTAQCNEFVKFELLKIHGRLSETHKGARLRVLSEIDRNNRTSMIPRTVDHFEINPSNADLRP